MLLTMIQDRQSGFEVFSFCRKDRRDKAAVDVRRIIVRFLIFAITYFGNDTIKAVIFAFLIGKYLCTDGVGDVTIGKAVIDAV